MSSTRVLLAVKNPANVYSYVRNELESGSRVIYLSTLSGADLITQISKYWSGVSRYARSKQLSIQSAYVLFPGGAGNDAVSKKSHTGSSESLNSNRNSIIIMCPVAVAEYLRAYLPRSRLESMTIYSRVNTILKFETSVSKRYPNSIVVCCVSNRYVQNLDLFQLLIFMRYHGIAIRKDGEIVPLSDHDIIDAIKKGIDVVMGEGSSKLIFKTLLHICNIDENAIFQRPLEWNNALTKVCGKDYANLILDAVVVEIRKLIM